MLDRLNAGGKRRVANGARSSGFLQESIGFLNKPDDCFTGRRFDRPAKRREHAFQTGELCLGFLGVLLQGLL